MGEISNKEYWKEVQSLYSEDNMVTDINYMYGKYESPEYKKITKQIENMEDARLDRIAKGEAKYNAQLYGKLLKKYRANPESLSWDESHLLAELKKQDANGELDVKDVTDRDIEKLKQKVLEEYNSLTKILQKLGINLSPVSEFDEKTILTNIKSAVQELKNRKNPEFEQEKEPNEDTETVDVKKELEIRKGVYDAVPIVELQLEEDIPGIGHKGEKMRVYKDGYSVF